MSVPRHHAFTALLLLLLTSCGGEARGEARRVDGGDVERGRAALRSYGCGACHIIPGIPEGRGLAGPPLDAWGRRPYIAGHAGNSVENLVLFIQTPQAIRPNTAMPNLGVTNVDARDMAAYLYTLR